MGQYAIDMDRYKALARQAVAEGCVLLENKDRALPIRENDRVAVFGRMAFHYYKSGLGSGGLVNTRYTISILDALRQEKNISLEESVSKIYEDWIEAHPFDEGQGWGKVPWSQEEMPVTEELLEAAKGADLALVVIGRTAGEDQDTGAVPGQYLLTETEKDLIARVSSAFPRTVVLLNVGNIIDMKWVKECSPAAVMYVWQGGQEGGNGVCDVLMGRISPCGKLTDTIAEDIRDYPSTANFGDPVKNIYQEDIYVGYRYFETFAREKVLYPFGYGLSYTTFSIEGGGKGQTEKHTQVLSYDRQGDLMVEATVANTGTLPGKEVLQVYAQAPAGRLGKPERVLVGFAKTRELQPGQSQTLQMQVPLASLASFDDTGVTGHPNCFVLEEGDYSLLVGGDVRSAGIWASFHTPLRLVEELEEALAPREAFDRIRPGDKREVTMEPVPLRTFGPYDRMKKPEPLAYTGDRGYLLRDVYEGRVSMDTFLAQLGPEDLAALFRGEGMSCVKVTPGTGSGFGGLTPGLRKLGIPAACTTDGPSGLRMDVGTKAFSLPNGTLLGCTFNEELVEELYAMTGKELRANRVDALLGPGMNIHRNPLNGRNFEYISEDPLVTGKIAAAQLRGIHVAGSVGTIKHFCCNNQEFHRREAESVVSQRALREIYLKCFEIAVKEGDAKAVMTTYGPVNGLWTAGCHDLLELVLRKEWGYQGIVMTDWWAEANLEGQPQDMKCHAAMISAGNDLYMVTERADDNEQDDVMEALEEGRLSLGELQRNARRILQFILQSPAMLYEMDQIGEEELEDIRALREEEEFDLGDLIYYEADESGDIHIPVSDWNTSNGRSVLVGIHARAMCNYDLEIRAKSDLDNLAQMSLSIFYDNVLKETLNFRGSQGVWETRTRDFGYVFGKTHYLKFYFGGSGLELGELVLRVRD